jgi:DNA-binding transcriptional LysR family regulator
MELNYLRSFYEVTKDGSFTAAARRLHISQSALSKAVALLESQEGVKLLVRSKAGVTLTPIGQEIFAKAEKLFALVAEIKATCKGREEVCEGLLAFGASDHVSNYLLLPILKEMQEIFPGVLPRMMGGTPNENIERLIRAEIEFAMSFTRVSSPSIKYEAIASMEMVVVASPELLRREKSPSLSRLIEKYGLIGSPKTQYQHHPLSPLTATLAQEPKLTLEASTQEAQKRYCILGVGIAYLARFMVESELREGNLVELRLKKPQFVTLLLATRRDRELSLNSKTFLEIVRRTCGKDAEGQ